MGKETKWGGSENQEEVCLSICGSIPSKKRSFKTWKQSKKSDSETYRYGQKWSYTIRIVQSLTEVEKDGDPHCK